MSVDPPIDWRSIVVMLVFCRIFPDPFIIGGAAACIAYMLGTRAYAWLTRRERMKMFAKGSPEEFIAAAKNEQIREDLYEQNIQWIFSPILFCVAAATSVEIAATVGGGCVVAYVGHIIIARLRAHVARKRLGWRLNLADMLIK
jgi:hypothetical protein